MMRPIHIAPDGTVSIAVRECDAIRTVYVERALARREEAAASDRAITAALIKAWVEGGEGRPSRPEFGRRGV